MGRFRVALQAGALVFLLFTAYSLPVAADELQDITLLHNQGESPKALERLDIYLSRPADSQNTKIAEARFLKGLILGGQGKITEAIDIFVSLTEHYPELPEPYNNLAVLYAMQGHMDKARQALEMAINAHPGYAIAHENLGDVYIQIASQSYDKALQLDQGNATARTKLARVREIFPNAGKLAPTTTNNKAGM